MTRIKRTKRQRVAVSSERKQRRLQAFDLELVPVRDGDEVTSGPSRINPVVHSLALTSHTIPPVPSLKAFLRSQRHPEIGTFGKRCTLKTNYFVVRLHKDHIHQYDVRISPKVISSDVNHAVMRKLVCLHRNSDLSDFHPAYDGRRHLYTAGELPFTYRTFEIELPDEEVIFGDEHAPWSHIRVRQFKVIIKFAARVNLRHLVDFVWGHKDELQVALQVLDIILREIFIGRGCPIERPFQLDEGLDIYHGFYQRLQLTQKRLLVNIDVSSTISVKLMPLIDYITQLLDGRSLDEPLCYGDHLKIEKALVGVLVHFHNMHTNYRVFGLTLETTHDLIAPIDDRGTMSAFLPYFEEAHNCCIRHISLPCLQVGNKQRPIFLPIEVCKITEGQRFSKQLNQEQMHALRAIDCLHPLCREQHILQYIVLSSLSCHVFGSRTLNYNCCYEKPYAEEFGIEIEKQLLSLKARVLLPPWLKFHDSGTNNEFLPRAGQWNMVRKRMFNGGRVNNWTCVNFSWDVDNKIVRSFCHELSVMCQASGINFSVDPVLPVVTASPEDVECTLKSYHQDAMKMLGPQGRELDLLIVILPNNKGSLYGDIKRICETDIGLVSQCCLAKNVLKTCMERKRSKQYLANVALKINVKVGGKNAVLLDAFTKRLPCVGEVPTIIFGAHVMHPGKGSGPSIAAVVASQDWPEVTKYAGLASLQAHCQELIEDLFHVPHDFKTGDIAGGMIIEHLISFKRATGQKPQRIIFYRDAVSSGQLYQVMWQELVAIKKACSYLESDYNPSVTYVVLQKPHHTRFFADSDDDQFLFDGSILPGTVVDSDICHPNEFGFYLCSREATEGMMRPVHYHILVDENRFTADTFQCLTYFLCYTYARCTHSVSIVPHVYYAHLMASRGHLYMESMRMASEAASTSDGNVKVPCLPAVKDNLKSVMFYC